VQPCRTRGPFSPCAYMYRTSEKLGMPETNSLGRGVTDPLETCYSPTCVVVPNLQISSWVKRVWFDRGHKNFGDASKSLVISRTSYMLMICKYSSDVGVADPHKYASPRHLNCHTKFSQSRSDPTSVIMEICQKIVTPHAPRFNVTQGHWNRHGSIGYL